jgi:hypothetical protein
MTSMDDELLSKMPENDSHRLYKEAAVRFLSLIAAGKPKDGWVFFTPDCITHSPYTTGDMDALSVTKPKKRIHRKNRMAVRRQQYSKHNLAFPLAIRVPKLVS